MEVGKKTLLSEQRTLLAEIRTSSIFIGLTFLIYFKIIDPFYKKMLLYILGLTGIINTFLVLSISVMYFKSFILFSLYFLFKDLYTIGLTLFIDLIFVL